MVLALAALVVAFGLGFGLGRIKNASKLAAVKALAVKLEGEAQAEGLLVIAKIKALL